MFRPAIANQYEARCGVDKLLDSNALTLNIGNSFDLLSWKTEKTGKTVTGGNSGVNTQEWRIGTDLFTWTLINAEPDFRFPVEEVNYLFGLNATWMHTEQASENALPVINSFRFRISHISCHTVDGMFDNYTQQFTYQEPFTFSEEFFDGLYSYQNSWNNAVAYRVLAGAKVLFHQIMPNTITAFSPHYGLELFLPPATITPYLAYYGSMQKITAWQGENEIQAGVKLGKWDAGGASAYIAYYQGKNVNGELYILNASELSVGWNFSF